ncbi:MAG: AAA family ATPase, partial [Parafilimonas terrae]|nr:AAA family ATPase [Parafilimonas terrae]
AIQALGTLHRAFRVERVGKAYILSLGVTAGTAEKAARLANALASAFVRDQREAYLEATRRKALFYAERLSPLSDQLRHAEQALDAFRHNNDLLAKSPSGQTPTGQATINEQQLAELNSRLVAARAVTAEARARWDQARQIAAASGQLDAVPEVVGSAAIAQLRQQQAEVARKEADLASHYSDGHPALAAARAEKREIDRNIAREVARIVANLKGSYDIAAAQEQGLTADLGRATAAAGVDSDLGLRLRELERVRTVDQTLFETYLTRAKEAEQQANYEERDIRVISPAEVPSVPAVPQASLALALALAVGLGLGIGAGLALDAFENGFATAEQVEAAFALPVLAAVPWLSPRARMVEGRVVDLPRFLAGAPQSRYAEAVHAVRAGIRRSGGFPAGIVLVTSSASGEGKSNLALSLGVSAARSGQRVLLLDADLRQPTMSRYFGFEHRLGLVDMLSGLVGTAETTVPLAPGLAIMPSGRATAAAPDLFASERMAHYLAFVRRSYDLVVIDAAPSAEVVDAAILADLSDRIVFVVGWRSTARATARHAVEALGQKRKFAGIVLNAVNRSRIPRFGRTAGHLRAEPFHAVA